MTVACSIDAGQLVPADKKRYDNITRGKTIRDEDGEDVYVGVWALREQEVEDMIKEARVERAALINEVQLRHPGLINSDGRFISDLAALTRQREAQYELFPEKEKPSAKKTKQDGDKKPSPGGVAEGEQAGGPKPAASRAAGLKKPRPSKKSESTKTAGLKAKGPKRAAKKPAEAATESKSVRREQEVQAEREVEQPPVVDTKPLNVAGKSAEDLVDEFKGVKVLEAFDDLVTNHKGEDFKEGVRGYLKAALFGLSTTQNVIDGAREVLYDHLGPLWEVDNASITRGVFVDLMSAQVRQTAEGTSTEEQSLSSSEMVMDPEYFQGGELTPWAKFALVSGALDKVHLLAPTAPKLPTAKKRLSLSEEAQDELAAIESAIEGIENRQDLVRELAKDLNVSMVSAHTLALQDKLNNIERQIANSPRSPGIGKDQRFDQERSANLLFLEVSPEELASETHRGVPLSEWFTKGKLRWASLGKKFILDAPPNDKLEASKLELDQAMDDGPGGLSSLVRTDGTPITKPMSHGAVKMQVGKIMRKFISAIRPQVFVYKNLADLKQKNDKLWREAVASRKDILERRAAGLLPKDIPENSAGYAFAVKGKGRVIVFSDNIADAQHLRFVLAHEVLGHFGFAAIMPKAELNSLMNEIYEQDEIIQAAADKHMALYGTAKAEAIQEALADYAAHIDVSILRKIWNVIANFLNTIGFKFDDDMARYFVYQSRRYVRQGIAPTPSDVSPSSIHIALQNLQELAVEGMASQIVQNASIASRGAFTFATQDQMMRFIPTKENIKNNYNGVADFISRGLAHVKTLKQKGLQNFGIEELYGIFLKQTQDVNYAKNVLNRKTEFLHRFNIFDKFGGGPSKEDAKEGGRLAVMARIGLRHLFQRTEKMLGIVGDLVTIDSDGKVIRRGEAIKKATAIGTKTKADFLKGWKVEGLDDAGKIVENADPFKVGSVSDGAMKVYQQIRDGVVEAALLVLEGTVKGHSANRQRLFNSLRQQFKDLDKESRDTLEVIADIHSEIYMRAPEGSDEVGIKWKASNTALAEEFLRKALRVFLTKDKDGKDFGAFAAKDWADGTTGTSLRDEQLKELRNDKLVKPIIPRIVALQRINMNLTSVESLNSTISNMLLTSTQISEAQLRAKKTIMSGYVPVRRRGRIQVLIRAVSDETGDPVTLIDGLGSTFTYARTNSMTTAKRLEDDLRKAYTTSGPTRVPVLDSSTGKTEMVAVNFEVFNETGDEFAPLGQSINYDEFVQVFTNLNIGLTPRERQAMVETLAKHHSFARSSLEFDATPGWDTDIVRGTSEYLELQAHLAGKNAHQHEIAELLSPRTSAQSKWLGSKKKLQDLREAWESAERQNNPNKEHLTRQAYIQYAYQYINSASGDIKIKQPGRKPDKTIRGKGQGRAARTAGIQLMAFQNSAHDIQDTLDSRVDQVSGLFMEISAVLQLGLSVATSIVNLASIETHAVPWLSTFNKKTGYGGGFGMIASEIAIHRAVKDMNLFSRKLTTAKGLQDMIKDGSWVRNGFESVDEAKFMLEQTINGVTAPALSNALTGTARAGRAKALRTKGVEYAMILFTGTERFNRRVVALAAYRLQKQRMITAGKSEAGLSDPNSLLYRQLYDFATNAVNSSQGDYALYNRPAWARSGLGKVLYTYKQFVVISVELMSNMAPKERIAFLGMLWLLGGIKGLPFADDLLDVIDTLKQKFGIKARDMEVVIADLANWVIPSESGVAARIALRGLFDFTASTTGSTRFGQGDLLPGSGAFKHGADAGREMTNIFGPVASAIKGLVGAGATLTKYIAESIGLREDQTSFVDVLRTGGGSSAVRSFVESFIYMHDGSITDHRGRTIAKDVGAWGVLTRMLGFYPGVATLANDVVRLGKSQGEYTKALKRGFIDAARRADAAGNRAEIRRIKRDVRAHNRAVGRKSPLFINEFSSSLVKAIREGRLTTPARFLKSTSKANKEFTKHVMKLYGFDPRGVPLD